MTMTLVKQPAESRLYDFEFDSIVDGVTLFATPTIAQTNLGQVAGSSPLTLGSPVISGSKVQVRVSGGTDGETYKLTATAVDSASNTLEMEGRIAVRDL